MRAFIKRIFLHLSIGFFIIIVSLGLGMWGYSHYENMNVVDSYVNATMILSGMGPVSELHTDNGKLFAGSYALFSGIVFLVVIAIFIAQIQTEASEQRPVVAVHRPVEAADHRPLQAAEDALRIPRQCGHGLPAASRGPGCAA